MSNINLSSNKKKAKEKAMQQAVDLVYLWVDGSDPKWVEKKTTFLRGEKIDRESNAKGRFFDNEELKYSLRSVEKYVPWVRKIVIVTDDQQPDWLDSTHPKIQIIDHRQILPAEALPCFNSSVIECFLYKIQGLSEQFLYANDDMFFNRKLTPDFFFGKEGYPIIRLKKTYLGRGYDRFRTLIGKPPGYYRQMIYHGIDLIKEKYGKNFRGIPHHNIDAYKKADYQKAVETVFQNKIIESTRNHLRADNDIQRFAFSLYALAIGHAHLQYIKKDTSLRNQIHKDDAKARLEKYNPALFCMNDNQKATDEDRKKTKAFLEQYFPNKSAFEK